MGDLMVCIGGGGQHVALAVARLVRLGVWTNTPEVFVIDAEEGAPLNTRLRDFRAPNTGGDVASPGGDGLPHPLPSAGKINPPFDRGKLKGPFPELFLNNESKSLERELFDLFFDPVTAGVDVSKGMYARPSVGATVFAEAGTAHIQKDLTDAMSRCEHVLVASSFVGGTGAGISHQLIRQLRDHLKGGGAVHQKKLYGAFLARWFTIPGAGKDTANNTTIINSMNHGIDFLARQTRLFLDRSMVLGGYDGMALAEAKEDNDEIVSPFPVLAAFALTKLRGNTTGSEHHEVMTLAAPEDDRNSRWLLEQAWTTGPKVTPTIGDRWKAALAFMDLVEVMEAHRHEFDTLHAEGLGAGVFSGENWGKIIRTVAEKSHTDRDKLARSVFDRLLARKRQLRFVTDWLGHKDLFGTASLAGFGLPGLKQLSNEFEARKVTHTMAYARFARSFAHVQPEVTKWARDGAGAARGEDAAGYLARMIETALDADLQA